VTLPKGLHPLEISLEEALQLIAAKEGRLRARGRDPYEVSNGRKGCVVVGGLLWHVVDKCTRVRVSYPKPWLPVVACGG